MQPHADATSRGPEHLLSAAWQSLYLADRQRTQRLALQASAAGRSAGDPTIHLAGRILHQMAAHRVSTPEAARASLQALADEAAALGVPRMLWLAADALAVVSLAGGDPVSALQLAVATADVPMAQRSLDEAIHAEFLRGVACCWAGKVDEGLHCGWRMLHLARLLGQGPQLAVALSFLADVYVNRFGNAEDALPLAMEADELLRPMQVSSLQVNNLVVCIDALQALGRHEQARTLLQAGKAVHAGSGIWLRRGPRLALQYVRAGLLDDADACLAEFMPDAPGEPFMAWEWRLSAVMLHLARQEHAQALDLARVELARSLAVDRPARQLLTMHDAIRQCCQALGDSAGAAAAAQRAQELLVPVLRDAAVAHYLTLDLATAPLLPAAQRPADRRRLQAIDRRAREPQPAQAGPSVPRFVAHVTHELASPVSGFMWLSEALLRTPLDERQRAHVQALHRGAADMQQLVTDVLDLARMERGLFVLHPRPVALQSCLEQCFLAFAVPGHARGLQMHLQLAPDLPQAVRMDAVRVRQVLNNLLGNALKFTDAGSITLRAQWQPRAASARAGPAAGILQLSVHDTGRGIAPDVMQRLFVEFEQGDDAIAPLYGGYGLGLALCRQLLQLMGGQITAHSQPGQGSSFHVQLPLDLAELDTEAAAPGDGAAAPAVQAPAPGPGVGA